MRFTSSRRTAAFLLSSLFTLSLHANYQVTNADVTFDTQTFVGSGQWYLMHTGDPTGLSDAGKLATLSSVAHLIDTSTKVVSLNFVPQVSKKVNINMALLDKGEGRNARKEVVMSDNPLHGAQLHHLAACHAASPGTIQASSPVVSYGTVAAGKATDVAWLSDVADSNGVSYPGLLKNTTPLLDAAGAAIERIENLTCGLRSRIVNENGYDSVESEEHVIVAVRGNGKGSFNGTGGDGLAVLQKKTTARDYTDKTFGLIPVNSVGQPGSAIAAAVEDALIKVAGNGAITGVETMLWDPVLQRLFVSLSLDNAGGVGVLVGNVSLTSSAAKESDRKVNLSLQPIIADSTKANLANWGDTDDHVIGIKASKTVAVSHLKVLHSSTGKSYLVTVGGVDGLSRHVHALPILRAATAAFGEDAIGTLAKKDEQLLKATTSAHLYTKENEAAWVGGAVAPDAVKDVFVMGDTVYISLAHATDPAKQGMLASTALFDDKGYIRGWTTWQRALGRVGRTFGGGRDTLGRYWALTVDGSGDTNTILTTAWGTGDGNALMGGPAGNAAAGLVSQLNVAFPRTAGGLHALHPFEKTNQHLNDSTLLVAAGRNKVAVVLTEKNGAVSTGADFNDERLQLRNLADDDLDLGMITSAQISNLATSGGDDGWLFVGGANGLAVLRQANGKGWSALDDLTGIAGYSFKEIKKADGSSFTDVKSLTADGAYLYVLTHKALYKIAYDDANKWKDTGASATGEIEIATPFSLTGQSGHVFITGQLLGSGYVLATTGGLWTMNGAGKTIQNATSADWRELYVDATKKSGLGVCADLTFLPAATNAVGAAGGGNLYVLSADTSLNIGTVYRLAFDRDDCAAATVTAVGSSVWSYYTILGQLREYFYTDGALAYDLGSFHKAYEFSTGLGNPQTPMPLRLLPQGTAQAQIDVWLSGVMPSELAITDADHTVGKITQDPASGTLLLPGVWGVKVQQ